MDTPPRRVVGVAIRRPQGAGMGIPLHQAVVEDIPVAGVDTPLPRAADIALPLLRTAVAAVAEVRTAGGESRCRVSGVRGKGKV